MLNASRKLKREIKKTEKWKHSRNLNRQNKTTSSRYLLSTQNKQENKKVEIFKKSKTSKTSLPCLNTAALARESEGTRPGWWSGSLPESGETWTPIVHIASLLDRSQYEIDYWTFLFLIVYIKLENPRRQSLFISGYQI